MQFIRELEIMEFLENTSMKNFFAGCRTAFSPSVELKKMRIQNVFVVMKLRKKTLADFMKHA